MLVEHINNVNMIKKRGRNIIIRRGTIKVSFFDTSLFNDKVYDEDITRVIVKSDFDFDDDMGSHFSEYPNLKGFRMANSYSEFEVHDDIMYMRLSEKAIRKSIGWNCGFFDYNNNVSTQITEGLVLVCCPPKINHKDIVLHKDCTVIYGSAFEGCDLNSLTIPSTFRYGCPAAFTNLTVKTLYVPNKLNVFLESSHNNVNKDVIVECIDGDGTTKEKICSWWKSAITGEY